MHQLHIFHLYVFTLSYADQIKLIYILYMQVRFPGDIAPGRRARRSNCLSEYIGIYHPQKGAIPAPGQYVRMKLNPCGMFIRLYLPIGQKYGTLSGICMPLINIRFWTSIRDKPLAQNFTRHLWLERETSYEIQVANFPTCNRQFLI